MLYRASWILPITGPPIREGWIAVDRGRVIAIGSGRPSAPSGDSESREIDLGQVAVLPGLVNAHTHLELSWMRGRLPAVSSFPEWIRALLAARREAEAGAEGLVTAAIREAIAEMRRAGTAVVGDITNTLAPVAALAENSMPAVVFKELIGFRSADADRVVAAGRGDLGCIPLRDHLRASLAAHAPYSVSPRLFGAIKAELDRHAGAPCSVHLAESVEELEFLRTGHGPWRALLDELGVWEPDWEPPACGPVAYLERLGFLGSRVLAVHGVQLTRGEIERLAALGVTLVVCPRGNRLTGAGAPPIAQFYEAGLRVAVGTDSLASVPDLNLFGELAELRRLTPSVPASAFLESATRAGALALGFGDEFGAIESGMRAALIAVDIPPNVTDVEEYLVSGIRPEQIRWLI